MEDTKKTHIKGLVGELEFSLRLLEKGWNVYRPIDPNSRADLVVEKDGNYKKIQVKYCTPREGCLQIELVRPMRKTKPYSLEEVDDVGVFDPITKKCYLISLREILPRKRIWLRVDETHNGCNDKHINWAEKYLI